MLGKPHLTMEYGAREVYSAKAPFAKELSIIRGYSYSKSN